MNVAPKMRFAPDLLQDKVALVTGGGSGMGRATAIELARCGARIALLGRRPQPLLDCAEEIRSFGGASLAIPADIRETDQIELAMTAIKAEFGRLDILVNNAGGQFVAPARDLNNKGFETVIRNNLIGTWQMTKAVADHFMLANGGSVVFVTACVRSGLSGFVHTAAARGGVLAMMKTLAFEWAEYGIRLNCVAPGTIKTDGMGHYPISPDQWLKLNRNVLGHMGDVEDVAGAIVFLSSPLGKFVTGEEWYIDGEKTLHLAHDARQMIDAVRYCPARTRRRQAGIAENAMSNAVSYVWTPPPELVEQSNLTAFLRAIGQPDYDTLAEKAEADPAWLMEQVFNFCDVRFNRRYDTMLDVSRGEPWARWCVGGTTNVVLNCIDKHRGTAVCERPFLVWEGEDRREQRTLIYREFADDLDRLARALRGPASARERGCDYMPNLPGLLPRSLRS